MPEMRQCSEPGCTNKVLDGWRCNKCKDQLEPIRVNGKRKWDLPSMQAQLKAWALEARLNKNGEKLEKAVVEALF